MLLRPVSAFILSCILLFLGYWGYWYYSMDLASQRVAPLVARLTGGQVTVGTVSWDRHPTQARMHVRGMEVKIPKNGRTYVLRPGPFSIERDLFSESGYTIKFGDKHRVIVQESGSSRAFDLVTDDATMVLLPEISDSVDYSFSTAALKVYAQRPEPSVTTARAFVSTLHGAEGMSLKFSLADLRIGHDPARQDVYDLLVFEGVMDRFDYMDIPLAVSLMNVESSHWVDDLKHAFSQASSAQTALHFANVQLKRGEFWFSSRIEVAMSKMGQMLGQISCTTNDGEAVIRQLDGLQVLSASEILSHRVFRKILDRLDVVSLDFDLREKNTTLNGLSVGEMPAVERVIHSLFKKSGRRDV